MTNAARHENDPETTERIVRENIGLAMHIARSYSHLLPPPCDSEGLVGECSIALLIAARRYDLGRGIPLKLWLGRSMANRAVSYIRKEILRGLTGQPVGGELATCCVATDATGDDGLSPIDFAASREDRHVRWPAQMWRKVYGLVGDDEAKRIVRLHFRRGLSQAKVARRMGTQRSRINERLKTITRRIRQAMPNLAAELG